MATHRTTLGVKSPLLLWLPAGSAGERNQLQFRLAHGCGLDGQVGCVGWVDGVPDIASLEL